MNLTAIRDKLDGFLADKVAPLPQVQKVALAVIPFALAAAAFYFLVYTPNVEHLARLSAQQADLQREIDDLMAKRKDLPKFERELAEAERRFAAVSILLPQEKEIPTLLTNISGLGTSSGLDFISFRPQNEVTKDFYAEIPVEIKVSGRYHNLGLFFDRLAKLPRIVTVSAVNMGAPKRQGKEMVIDTSFTLMTYRFLENSDHGKKKKKKK